MWNRALLWSSLCLLPLGLSVRLSADEEVEDLRLGGSNGTVFDKAAQAFSLPFVPLARLERLQFQAGDALFTDPWVMAPSSTEGRDGLGPLFNARSCSNCHLKDGRGAPPSDDPTELATGLLFRISSAHPHAYGDQIQDMALPSLAPEAKIAIQWVESSHVYPDGTVVSLRKPNVSFQNLGYGPLPDDALVSPRLAPPMIGLGLLEALSPDHILENADESDANGDGISGRANFVDDVKTGQKALGRFGWKANQPNLNQQNAGAFLGDMGLSTSLFPHENCTTSQSQCLNQPNGGVPEISDKQLALVELYSRFLAVPARRDTANPDVVRGRELFFEMGCTACHRPTMTTRPDAAHALLASQKIWPYTDLLLHDMGEELADHRPDGEATGNEWRTSPLWGIGLTATINGRMFFLHDGRARTIEEAILWHGGEALASKNHFSALPKEDREKLLKFVNSL